MKIVFIGGRDVRMLGGIENYMYNLATQLSRLGHTPIVYCESDHNGTQIIGGFEVRFVKGPKSNLLCKPWVGLRATLRTVFKEKNVDLVHYNAWPPSLWSWIPRLAGIATLMEGHGQEWKRSKYGPLQQRILKLMERLTAHLNRNLIMCSEDQVAFFCDNYGVRSVCIPGAINLPDPATVDLQSAGDSSDTAAVPAAASDILDRFGLAGGRYFLFMGRLVQDKNPDYLIRAFIGAALQGYKLVIAGNNDALPDYVSYLHGITDSRDVVFTGAVYGEDKAALLRNAFVFCLPSSIEGLSIVLMEAMSYSLPIIASDIQANRELLGGNALFVQPENEESLRCALMQALSFPSFGVFTSENYRKIASEYTWPAITRRYLEYVASIYAARS